jgi:hypothetical protein
MYSSCDDVITQSKFDKKRRGFALVDGFIVFIASQTKSLATKIKKKRFMVTGLSPIHWVLAI